MGVPAVTQCPPPSHAGRGEYSGSVLLPDVPPHQEKVLHVDKSFHANMHFFLHMPVNMPVNVNMHFFPNMHAAALAAERLVDATKEAEETATVILFQ